MLRHREHASGREITERAAAGFLVPRIAAAQIDYRNLDDDRPRAVEDAYLIERYAFEFLLPHPMTRAPGLATT